MCWRATTFLQNHKSFQSDVEGSLPKALSKALNIPGDAFPFACLKSLIMGDEEIQNIQRVILRG